MTPAADTAHAPASGSTPRPHALERAQQLGRPAPVRAWTPLGTVDSGPLVDVDGAGGVQVRGARWCLDWWVGAEDRWHHPSREAAVRQQGVEDTPVLETAMRVPGGDVVHRAYAARAGMPAEADAAGWDGAAVAVEVHNGTPVPVALALALLPATLDGAGSLRSVEVDGPVVRVDGRVALVLSRPPARLVHGTRGDAADRLARGDDLEGAAITLRDDGGRLEVALVVPLPHGATLRALVVPEEPAAGRSRKRAAPVPEPGPGWHAPDHEAVVRGWQAHTRSAARVELPEPLLGRVLAASLGSLAVAAGDDLLGEQPREHAPGSQDAATRAAWVCETLARSGLHEPLGPLARALAASQRLGGAVALADRSDAGVALLHAAAPLLRTGGDGWVDDLLGPVAKVVHRIGRDVARGRRAPDRHAADALARLAPALRAIGQPDVADEAERLAARLRPADPPAAGDAVADLLERCRLGAPGSLPDLLDADGVPGGALGFDPAAVARRAGAVLDAVVAEGAEGPVLLPAWPSSWWGQSIEAHGVRTRWGTTSFAVRWHGERPAVLWEVEATGEHDPEPVLTAPALDPAWRGEGRAGDALLSPVEVPPTLVAIRGASPAPAPATGPVSSDAPPAGAPPGEGDSFS